MRLQLIDILILISYLICMVLLGLFLRKKAKANKESYLLGGKSIPWYMLGLSNASDMFDISGTMWLVSITMVYGFKAIWIPWLWPVFNQIFNMVYLSKWLRRSNATTGAEWLASRFGTTGKGVKGSHTIVVAFAIISCLGFMAYGFIGLGKFIEIFIPWQIIEPYMPFTIAPQYVAHFYGIVFTLFAVFYSVLGGMHSIVLGDVIKYVIMTIGCVAIGIIAMQHLKTSELVVPGTWYNPFFGAKLDVDWTGILDAANHKIKSDGYGLFGIFFMMMLFKGILNSLAGFAPNYDMQKTLSAKSPSEAAKMSGFVSVVLMPVRYMMIMGVAVLGLLYFKELNVSNEAGITDFERVLPSVINNFVPAGLLGIIITGLLGAYMGTFSGTLNAAQAYIVNDIYLKHINPQASNKKIISMNYLVGVLVVAVGIGIGFFIEDVNAILQWLVSGLWGGYIAANILKWYWWRFNANGYYYGMIVGVAGALILSSFVSGVDFLYWFPVLFLVSMAGCLIGTYTAPATDKAVLEKFYSSVKPWGFWSPVHSGVLQKDAGFKKNTDFKLDMLNIILGIIGQTCLVLIPMYFILWHKTPLFITSGVLLIILIIMKKTWWNKLKE